ncbi:hypothetical protein LTR56_021094 [Elasticomyces elasticus]|nr:hypothetical protein LTR56_021094 [Elasticomyces elasticus]KAK3631906.1 hypothetical protein LTR22_020839 [Elasticomyces elasticus]KAK4909727.1 hypothetical protein LTR49_021539 [Elasticomyces elasticus]KAK5749568.1 hypothetical protein LTS12_020355 [Elasticomyces elasticus]
MKLSLLSLISLAAGATALPTNQTDVSVAAFGIYNSTSVHENIHSNIMKVNTTNREQIAGNPSCFDCRDGNGISSGIAYAAMKYFCDRVAGMPLSNSGGANRGVDVLLNYINNPGSAPTGQVYVSVFASALGTCSSMTSTINSDTCVANLWPTISQCDSYDDSDRKTGATTIGIVYRT